MDYLKEDGWLQNVFLAVTLGVEKGMTPFPKLVSNASSNSKLKFKFKFKFKEIALFKFFYLVGFKFPLSDLFN